MRDKLGLLWGAFKIFCFIYALILVMRLLGLNIRIPYIDGIAFTIFNAILSLFAPGQDWARQLFNSPI